MKKNLSVFIPALKKNVAFQDDLVKKIAGTSLIQRSINKAINLCVDKSDVYILTDSEEIQLIAKRNSVRVFLDPDLVWDQVEFFSKLSDYLGQFIHKSEYILLLSPYAPLLTEDIICNALQSLVDSNYDVLKPVKHFKHSINDNKNQTFSNALFGSDVKTQIVESEVFILFRAKLLLGNQNQNVKIDVKKLMYSHFLKVLLLKVLLLKVLLLKVLLLKVLLLFHQHIIVSIMSVIYLKMVYITVYPSVKVIVHVQ